MALERFHFEGIFFLLVIGYIFVFLVVLIGFRNDNAVYQQKLSLRHTIHKMFYQKNLLRIYAISFALEFFYVMMIVYMPLYLRSLQFFPALREAAQWYTHH